MAARQQLNLLRLFDKLARLFEGSATSPLLPTFEQSLVCIGMMQSFHSSTTVNKVLVHQSLYAALFSPSSAGRQRLSSADCWLLGR
jgi:hypothetical protein